MGLDRFEDIGARFGAAVAALPGDASVSQNLSEPWDGKCPIVLAVGAPGYRSTHRAIPEGAIFMLCLSRDSMVLETEILVPCPESRLTFHLPPMTNATIQRMGSSVAFVGDVDGNGHPDLATAHGYKRGSNEQRVLILRMGSGTGAAGSLVPTVISTVSLNESTNEALAAEGTNRFGSAIVAMPSASGGLMNVSTIAVGHSQAGRGLIWLYHLDSTGIPTQVVKLGPGDCS